MIGKPLTHPYSDLNTEEAKLLRYISPPLEQDLEVTGHPILTLFLSSTTPDATVFAYLEDVDDRGNVIYVTEGQLRTLHRKLSQSPNEQLQFLPYRTYKREDALPLQPEKVARLVFDFLPTSYQFHKGHRIRLSLAGADKDHFAPLPGPVPTLTIFYSHLHPSHLHLPAVP